MQRARFATACLAALTLLVPAALANPPSFFVKVSSEQHYSGETPLEAESAAALRDAINRKLREALPCAQVGDEVDIRQTLDDARRAQQAGQSNPSQQARANELMERATNIMKAEYLVSVKVVKQGNLLLMYPYLLQPSAGKSNLLERKYYASVSDRKLLVESIENAAEQVTEEMIWRIKNAKCPTKYYFKGSSKAGRFTTDVEGFSQEGLFGLWDVYWTSSAEGDGVTTKMFMKEGVFTSKEPDNLGQITGQGWVYQHVAMGDFENQVYGTLNAQGTATIGGGVDDPTITLTLTSFDMDMSGAGSAGNDSFVTSAKTSGSKGTVNASRTVRGGGTGVQSNLEPREYLLTPMTYKVEEANGRKPPQTTPKPPPPAPGKAPSSSRDDEASDAIDETYDPDEPDTGSKYDEPDNEPGVE